MDLLMDLFILLATHAIGDYPLQGEYLATTKGRNTWHLLMHSVIYTACIVCGFYIITGITDLSAVTTFVLTSHVLIDYNKAHGYISYFLDQIGHMIVLSILYFGWALMVIK